MPAVGEIVEYRRWMDATLHSGGEVTCFHGEQECQANTLQLCAQNQTDNWQQWLNYSVCLDGRCWGPVLNLVGCAGSLAELAPTALVSADLLPRPVQDRFHWRPEPRGELRQASGTGLGGHAHVLDRSSGQAAAAAERCL